MKKYISLFICILLCLSLIGCSTENNNTEISSTSTITESTFTAEESTLTVSQSDAVPEQNSSSAPKSTASSTTKQQTTKPTAKADTTAKATQAATTTISNVTCTVTIECKTILGKMDHLKAGHEAYVPDNGIMLSSYRVTVKNGSTAFDAVKQACSSNGISMNTTTSSYGYYIAGFNNIDEKDCGSSSGWTYYVNDSMPNKSCSKYAVKNGDNIVFSYTC